MVVGASAPWRLLYFPISYAQARRNNAKATRTITRKILGKYQDKYKHKYQDKNKYKYQDKYKYKHKYQDKSSLVALILPNKLRSR